MPERPTDREFCRGSRDCRTVSDRQVDLLTVPHPTRISNESQHEDGTFAEHIVVKAALAFKIPANLSNVEAATLGLGATTVVCRPWVLCCAVLSDFVFPVFLFPC